MVHFCTLVVITFLPHASAHGWVTKPISKNELAHNHYQQGMPSAYHYDPQSSLGPNSCGAQSGYTEGLGKWQKWYDAAGVPVPSLTPGQDIQFKASITADHGGQAWVMIACDDSIREDVKWTFLERAHHDRDHHFMPSNPAIYAWATHEALDSMGGVVSAWWTVPKDFVCPSGYGVGRWLWKDGNTCSDVNNVGRKTETFSLDEFAEVIHKYKPGRWVPSPCGSRPEQFISCFDFVLKGIDAPPQGAPLPMPAALAPPSNAAAKTPTCCWSKWGDETTCGDYQGSGGLCNTDPTKKCSSDGDCPSSPAPSPTPPSPPGPSPPPSGGYPADKIRFIGRWFSGNGIATTNWGNSFMVKFTGSRTVGVTLSTVSSNDGGSQYFVASIDGGNLVRLNHPDAKSTLQLPFQLDPTKEHTLLFGRSDEASYGKTTLHDIALDQGYTALAQPAAHGLRYEVIGDSITAGFKVTGAPATSTEDVFKTYEYHLKEHWGIEDWSVIARSGIGVTDGWGQRPMHEQYVCSSFEFSGCPKQWDFSKWTADVVSINLGTNDFTFGTPTAAQFEKAYSDLVALVRAKYPEAVIFCIVPIIYSCFPSAPKWTTMRTAIENVVNKADSKVHFIPTGDASDPWLNCASEFSDYTHPTVEGHKKFAEKLQVLLDPLLPKKDVVIV